MMLSSDNWFEVESPPEITPEIEEKLDKTAKLLYEISELWSIPDTGVSGISEIPDGECTYYVEQTEQQKKEDQRRHKNFLFNWYQESPFVPLFFNAHYYAILKEKMSPYYKENKDD
jgi:hypothetical protein